MMPGMPYGEGGMMRGRGSSGHRMAEERKSQASKASPFPWQLASGGPALMGQGQPHFLGWDSPEEVAS